MWRLRTPTACGGRAATAFASVLPAAVVLKFGVAHFGTSRAMQALPSPLRGAYSAPSGASPARGRARGRGAPPAASPPFLRQSAEQLTALRQQFKASKSDKERREITREARRLVRATQMDVSTQDEKSVSVFLNSAAFFHCFPCEGIEQALLWSRRNLGGLSPQNVALLANAVGVLDPPDAEAILRNEISPVVQAVLPDMTPVEVVMVLQAFQRCHVTENMELQDYMLQHLRPCIPEMHSSHLSTLATVLAAHSLRRRQAEKWEELVGAIFDKSARDAATMHSHEVVPLLGVLRRVHGRPEQVLGLVRRATETARFHTDEQVATLLDSVGRIRSAAAPAPPAELEAALAALQTALAARLERVSKFAGLETIGAIWLNAARCNLALPAAVQETLSARVVSELAWSRVRFRTIAKVAKGAAAATLPSPAAPLVALSDFCVGKRPPRRAQGDSDGGAPAAAEGSMREGLPAADREALYVRYFVDLVRARLRLEDAFAAHAVPPPDSLTKVLPQELRRATDAVGLRALLTTAMSITHAKDDVPLRNSALDDYILSVAAAKAKETEALRKECTPAFLKVLVEQMEHNPRGEAIVSLVKNSGIILAAAPDAERKEEEKIR